MKNAKLRKILSLVLTLFIIISIPVGVYASDSSDKGITPYYNPCPSGSSPHAVNAVTDIIHHNSISEYRTCTHGYSQYGSLDVTYFSPYTLVNKCLTCNYTLSSTYYKNQTSSRCLNTVIEGK